MRTSSFRSFIAAIIIVVALIIACIPAFGQAQVFRQGINVGPNGGVTTTGGNLAIRTSGGTNKVTMAAATGNSVIGGTLGVTGAATFSSTLAMTAKNAASGSANPFDYTATLGIMNGSDDFTLFDVNITNADHTGSSNTVQVLDIAAITGDAQATETAVNIGSGWDTGVTSASPVAITSTLTVSGAVTMGRTAKTCPIIGAAVTDYDAQAATLTIAGLLGGVVTQNSKTGASTATTPTGAEISAGITGAATGDTFRCRFYNRGNQTSTITAGASGVTLAGTAAVPTLKCADLLFICTSANTWTVYIMLSA